MPCQESNDWAGETERYEMLGEGGGVSSLRDDGGGGGLLGLLCLGKRGL
jgi:hypothetical protein